MKPELFSIFGYAGASVRPKYQLTLFRSVSKARPVFVGLLMASCLLFITGVLLSLPASAQTSTTTPPTTQEPTTTAPPTTAAPVAVSSPAPQPVAVPAPVVVTSTETVSSPPLWFWFFLPAWVLVFLCVIWGYQVSKRRAWAATAYALSREVRRALTLVDVTHVASTSSSPELLATLYATFASQSVSTSLRLAAAGHVHNRERHEAIAALATEWTALCRAVDDDRYVRLMAFNGVQPDQLATSVLVVSRCAAYTSTACDSVESLALSLDRSLV